MEKVIFVDNFKFRFIENRNNYLKYRCSNDKYCKATMFIYDDGTRKYLSHSIKCKKRIEREFNKNNKNSTNEVNSDESKNKCKKRIEREFIKKNENKVNTDETNSQIESKVIVDIPHVHNIYTPLVECKQWDFFYHPLDEIMRKIGDWEALKDEILPKKTSSYMFTLSSPLTEDQKEIQMSSFKYAFKDKNQRFCDDLFYQDGLKELSFNKLPNHILNKYDTQVYYQAKAKSALAVYPPIKIVRDMHQGYLIKAIDHIKKYTFICEYSGMVYKSEDLLCADSDSVMILQHENKKKNKRISYIARQNY